jgi:hypothetical protein
MTGLELGVGRSNIVERVGALDRQGHLPISTLEVVWRVTSRDLSG